MSRSEVHGCCSSRTSPISCKTSLLSPAIAVPPERAVAEVYSDTDVTVEDEFLSEACGFQVTARIAGHYRETVFFNPDGSVKRVTAHPSFRSTLTSPTATITTADVGLDRFVENEDGTISIFATGIHLKLKGGEKGHRALATRLRPCDRRIRLGGVPRTLRC